MKVLITGGAGFIGSHLAEGLLEQGREVVVVDNLSTGQLSNIEGLIGQEGFEFVEGDICDGGLIESLAGRCEEIYHLAAAVGVKLVADDPVRTIETNIGGTEAVLEGANKFGRKILLVSSSEVYGKSKKVPLCEDDDMVLGSTKFSRWSYACSKAVDEFLGLAYYEQYGLPVVLVRFFNTVGPRQRGRYGMVIPRFVESALKNEPVCVYGTGQQSRCFAYVGDVVEGVLALMGCPQAVGGIFNVGSTEEISIEALADKIIMMTGSKSEKKLLSYEQAYGKAFDDMMRRVPNVELIKKTVGWAAKTNLDETLRIIIESFEDQQ